MADSSAVDWGANKNIAQRGGPFLSGPQDPLFLFLLFKNISK